MDEVKSKELKSIFSLVLNETIDNITEFKFEKLSGGFLSQIQRVNIKIKNSETKNLILKYAPEDYKEFKFFQRELLFYKEIQNQLNNFSSPTFFYAKFNENLEDGFIIIEDLGKDIKSKNINDGLEMDETKQILKEVVKLHNEFLTKENVIETYFKKYEMSTEAINEMNINLLLNLMNENLEKFELKDSIIEQLKKIDEKYLREIQLLKPQGICHGDLWMNNVLFSEDIFIIDFMICFENILLDIGSLIFSSMKDLNDEKINELLHYYHELLEYENFSFDNLKDNFEKCKPYFACYLIANLEAFGKERIQQNINYLLK
eukprot:gene45-4295_t